MSKILLVGFGGFVGAVLRYGISGWVQRWTGSVNFPYGTLAVNLLGCLVIGLLAGLAEDRGLFTPEARLFLFIGVLGAFTTFSTFGIETLNLLRDQNNLAAYANMMMSVGLGLGMVWLGRAAARLIWR